MAIRKPNADLTRSDYEHLKQNRYNDSNPQNPSHDANLPTNFEVKTITLEDIDQAVWLEFNKRFVVRDKQMPLISGDAELASLERQYAEQFDQDKGYLNGPFFVFTRVATDKKFRSNPTKKYVLYSVPKMKAQGVVIEDTIVTAPINYELLYDFKFVSDFRESMNQMEEQLNDYFKNKRNVIVLNNERFSIGPVDGQKVGDMEVVNKDNIGMRPLYVYTFKLKLWCYTIDASKVQKRERPNTWILDVVVKDHKDQKVEETKTVIHMEGQGEYPQHPEDTE